MTFYSFPNKGLPHSKNRHVPYQPRVKWGLAWALSFATVFSIWAAVVALLRHRTYFPQYHLSLWKIIAAYYVASFICGPALGFLYFLADRRWTAPILGFILAFVFYAVCGIAMFGFGGAPLLIGVIGGVIVGAGSGLVSYDEDHKKIGPDGFVTTRDQKPLAIVGVLAYVVFFAATQVRLPDYALYLVAALCVGAPIAVWLYLRRDRPTAPSSSSHAT